ncbi:MAG: hypothetical protein US68_C0001G0046 [Candidatus Shapirobacteria bacterium GW2011_GWE1_38_10]|uniref:Uncharacterized protein n=1 Tax=Candidatus Shapirobacteria bacterium GW2011_GWE1_38_10 TaxID=1618488 RepID=A0A0G0I8I2_9BACT|nr:MAG: hypothetical protein US46_C0004G0036 [Candidatus Shapirobacteria bacterium GW2011_GWF2_37_20]KKQ50847.1 MAG: hypothetical protein US68_C0001G0046 [Candidatus Shapirobacteria bacterium GW2011_GWE1_38_10]KKQ64854.1 MAG: hypothetical protein US85_C0002G0003 [Candidatus Shapirobacteria bacterium GW2011_GWF1_38_23]HBP51059.1 hypothetical protein [Candidatus Shapirobacteria bacterium]
MAREEVVRVIKGFSGSVGENGKWRGSGLVAPLITRVYLGAPAILLNLDEEECKKMIIRGIRQLTGVVIPEKYDPIFWNSEKGKVVAEKLNRRLPQLPEGRKVDRA